MNAHKTLRSKTSTLLLEVKHTQHSKNAYRAEHHFKLKHTTPIYQETRTTTGESLFIHHKTHASCCRHSYLASCLGVPVSSWGSMTLCVSISNIISLALSYIVSFVFYGLSCIFCPLPHVLGHVSQTLLCFIQLIRYTFPYSSDVVQYPRHRR